MASKPLDGRVEQLVAHLRRRSRAYGARSLQAVYGKRAEVLLRYSLDPQRMKQAEKKLGHRITVEDTVLNVLTEASSEYDSSDHHAGLAAECMAAEAVWDFIEGQ
jgi:hypothetical protein